jgi:hypothetical protein
LLGAGYSSQNRERSKSATVIQMALSARLVQSEMDSLAIRPVRTHWRRLYESINASFSISCSVSFYYAG